MDDGQFLIEGDLAIGVHRDLEGNGAALVADAADHLTVLQVQLDVAAAGRVLQSGIGTRCADGQRIGDGAGAIVAEGVGERAAEVTGGIGAEDGFIHLQAAAGDLARVDVRAVVLEADGVAQVEGGIAGVTVLVGDGRHQFHQVGGKTGGLVRVAGGVDDGQFLVEGDLAVGVHRDGEGNRPGRAAHAADHLPALQVQLDVTAAGGVLQAAVGTRGTDGQRVADAAGTVGAVAGGEGGAVVDGLVHQQVGFIHLQLAAGDLAGADARGIVAEADDLADVQAAAGGVAVAVGHRQVELDVAGAEEGRFVRVGGRVLDGTQLLEGDLAVRAHGQGEDHFAAGVADAAHDLAVLQEQHHVIAGLGVHQPGGRVGDFQPVVQAAQAIGTGLHVEQAAEISAGGGRGTQPEVGLIHLQLQGRAPGDAGADVVVVVIGGGGLVFPVLVAGVAGVLQVRATGVEGGVAEQHVGTVGAGQRGAADESLPLAAHQLEGDVGAVGQAAIGPAVGDDEEAGAGRVQVAQVESVAVALVMDVGPDHLAAERGAVVALDVVAIAVAVAGIGADEGHRGVQVQSAHLQGWGVIVDGHRQGTVGGVAIAVGDLVADVEGDVVLGAAHRVHQRFQQVDGVGAGGQVGQHHGHQVATGAADGQGVGRGVPG